MLGKLIKHEFKATRKVLLPLNLVLIATTLLGTILLSTDLLQRSELLPLSVTLLLTYILLLFASTTITTIYLIVHFYRSMFSAQGYLTFTLPTSPWSLLHTKAIVGFVWMIINSVLNLLSAFLLICAAAGFKNIVAQLDPEMTDSFRMGLQYTFGYTVSEMSVLFILMILCTCFYTVAAGYGSVAIGQLYAKHKVVGTVLAYVGSYFMQQIVMSVVIFTISFRSFSGMDTYGVYGMLPAIYRPMFPAMIIIYLVLGIIFYVAAGIIMKKKVNLD